MNKNSKTKTFKHKGNTYTVIQPSNKIRRESDSVYAKSYREAIQNGFFLEAEVEDILKARGYDEKTANKQKNTILKKVRSLESKLYKKGFGTKIEGQEIEFKIKDLREEYDSVDSAKNELTSQCANTIAENKRFSFFAYACVLNSDHDRIWDSFKDFEEDETDLAYTAATEVLGLIYESNQIVVRNMEKQKSENKWLMDNKLMDDDFNYLNEEGHMVDREGRLIDKDLNFIDTEGRRVDIFGNLINNDGDIISEEDSKKPTKKKSPTRKKATKKVAEPKTGSNP